MNEGAGAGGIGKGLIITVHLADGERLPLVVDTGSPFTILDKSVEQKLGKPLATMYAQNFARGINCTLYAAPALYLADMPLARSGRLGPYILTMDLKSIFGSDPRHLMGILGMDILRNYCMQLDFTERKVRFLDERRANKMDLGEQFTLVGDGNGCFYIRENLTGIRGPGSVIDTGFVYGGWLTPQLFQRWTNQASMVSNNEFHSPNGVLGGQLYHNLDMRASGTNDLYYTEFNGIGLPILSQNLVTLDFPERRMFLKRTSDHPPEDKDSK